MNQRYDMNTIMNPTLETQGNVGENPIKNQQFPQLQALSTENDKQSPVGPHLT